MEKWGFLDPPPKNAPKTPPHPKNLPFGGAPGAAGMTPKAVFTPILGVKTPPLFGVPGTLIISVTGPPREDLWGCSKPGVLGVSCSSGRFAGRGGGCFWDGKFGVPNSAKWQTPFLARKSPPKDGFRGIPHPQNGIPKKATQTILFSPHHNLVSTPPRKEDSMSKCT